MRFKDKSVIITGGGGKIAKAYAMALDSTAPVVVSDGIRKMCSCV